jgi:hypothetical protein
MLSSTRWCALLLLTTLCCHFSAHAQESDETPPMRPAVLTRATNLRKGPAKKYQRLSTLPAQIRIRLIGSEEVNGFRPAVTDKGKQGWVWAKNLTIFGNLLEAENLNIAAAAASNSGPCLGVTTIDQCPSTGCAKENTEAGKKQSLLNRTKERAPQGANAKLLTFDDFRSLQDQAGNLVGVGTTLDQTGRDLLNHLAIGSGTLREGSFVRISGFIASGPLDPHPNTGESVNCKLTEPENNDFHINIVEHQGETEFDGIVVEMIPQERSTEWTIDKLVTLEEKGRRVLVYGALFYDNMHVINDDPHHSIGGQPKRFSLWEVHPITKFLVCLRADTNCDVNHPNNMSQWKPLELHH